MERMAQKGNIEMSQAFYMEVWNGYERSKELEEENKNLKKEKGNIRQRLVALEKNLETLSRVKENKELREENKNLKSDLEQFSEAYKRYRDFEKEELAESCYDLERENKKLKEENEEYKKMFEAQLKEGYIKNTAKFLDKKFPKINGFMEEDTLQELRDIGEI